MGLVFNAVAGELPLVQRVWSASCDAATGFTSAAKTSSIIAFARSGAGFAVHLRGPETTGHTPGELRSGIPFLAL
jgi:hypothetical protein